MLQCIYHLDSILLRVPENFATQKHLHWLNYQINDSCRLIILVQGNSLVASNCSLMEIEQQTMVGLSVLWGEKCVVASALGY